MIGLVIATALKSRFSDDENKTPNKSSLVTSTILNTKITEFENKIPDFFFLYIYIYIYVYINKT